MPAREAALVALAVEFRMIAEEYEERNEPLPLDSTEIVHAWRSLRRISASGSDGWVSSKPEQLEATRRHRSPSLMRGRKAYNW